MLLLTSAGYIVWHRAAYSHGAALRNPHVKKNGKDFDPETLRNLRR